MLIGVGIDLPQIPPSLGGIILHVSQEFSHEVKLQLPIVVACLIIHLEFSPEFSHFFADVPVLYK